MAEPREGGGARHTALATADLAADHALAQISGSIRFLLDVTPVDSDAVREEFLATGEEPRFAYRELSTEPDVVTSMLAAVDLPSVEDPTLATLLTAKHREIELQVEMLRARDSEGFLPLSLEAYGSVSPTLLAAGERLVHALPAKEEAAPLDAGAFLLLAEQEIEHYRSISPDVDMQAHVRDDVSGVMVEGNALMIPTSARVAVQRADALLQHEVGTHLVTQVNGARQQIRCLGTGLAGYDETQEGLAVLAEIGCGGLTTSRLRQLGARVVTVHRLTQGASFRESYDALVDAGMPRATAFTTVMRIYRSGGLTKDAIYLRGLMDLLDHVRRGGDLALFYLGKFALRDLPLVAELHGRGVLAEPLVTPRFLDDPEAQGRITRATQVDDLVELTQH